jgi:hypothetical protein
MTRCLGNTKSSADCTILKCWRHWHAKQRRLVDTYRTTIVNQEEYREEDQIFLALNQDEDLDIPSENF